MKGFVGGRGGIAHGNLFTIFRGVQELQLWSAHAQKTKKWRNSCPYLPSHTHADPKDNLAPADKVFTSFQDTIGKNTLDTFFQKGSF